MGNCLVLQQEDMARVMKSDGKILEYKTPIKVHHVLEQFSGHAISETESSVLHHLHPNTSLLKGQLYYLLPHQVEGHVVRVKVVLSKRELKDMLQKERVSFDQILSLVQAHKGMDAVHVCKRDNDDHHGWKPALETIPE